MASDNELLEQIVRLLKRNRQDLSDEFIEDAAERGMAKPRHYQVAMNTTREWHGLRANFMRVVGDFRAGTFRAQGGTIGTIEINGGAPIPFPDCPEESGGAIHDETTNVESSIGHVAEFRMPIYSLKITNLFTVAATDLIHVYILDVGEYSQHAVTRLDTFDTYQKDILDRLLTMDTELAGIAMSALAVEMLVTAWDCNVGGAGQGIRNWPGT